MAAKVKNYTFSLPVEMIDKVREYADDNYITSINAGVKEAIEEYLMRLEKEKLIKEITEASKDPLFLKDIEECIHDFEAPDAETARRATDW
ncbi:hypothetical protein [Lutispora saccharofermentans]|uniref:CopG family transcriptional regulator n=1 Tax=Lutispora saccharofermentans TaxID=3024236 RepID=A0ABT1NHW2_9FIRM|nr:hypothetical protein [Lutispora saccharofermentans]MCQ1530179.1 hypothetical protein [Lutispora saccharofermentans]